MADDEKEKPVLSIKQKGFAMFSDSEKIKLTIDGKEVGGPLKSMDIRFDLEKVTTAYLELSDFELDLTDIPYEVNVDELHARKFLLKIRNFLRDFGNFKSMDAQMLIEEITDMTKGME